MVISHSYVSLPEGKNPPKIAGCFFFGKSQLKWMRTGGTPDWKPPFCTVKPYGPHITRLGTYLYSDVYHVTDSRNNMLFLYLIIMTAIMIVIIAIYIYICIYIYILWIYIYIIIMDLSLSIYIYIILYYGSLYIYIYYCRIYALITKDPSRPSPSPRHIGIETLKNFHRLGHERITSILRDRGQSITPSNRRLTYRNILFDISKHTKHFEEPYRKPWHNLCWLVVSTYPSEKYEFVSWDYEIPNIWKNKKCSKPPTSVAIQVFSPLPS